MEGPNVEKYEAENLIKKTEHEDKIEVSDIKIGDGLIIETGGSKYALEHREDGFYISGNEKYCPTPTKVIIQGCTWGGSMLMKDVISEGMRLEFTITDTNKTVTTSAIKKINNGSSAIAE